MASEADIPIDIHYNKLLEWLVSRRHAAPLWQDGVLAVRQRINTALQALPPDPELGRLLAGTYINYFHCLRIVELLQATDKGTSTLFSFGFYPPSVKDWLEIAKLYEKNGIYLAEAAQLLTRSVNFEIPALKRQMARCKQRHTDCARREGELATQASELRHKYREACRHMGIQGERIGPELRALASELPRVYERVGRGAAQLAPAVTHYSAFVAFILNSDAARDECVPLVAFLAEHGDVTTYEWRTGVAPLRVEEPPALALDDGGAAEEQTGADSEEIDWGDLDTTADMECGEEIDFGEDGIDWGGAQEEPVIELIADDTGVVSSLVGEEGVARGADALTLLDNTDTRGRVVNQLVELESFLGQRLSELSSPAILSASQLLGAPPSLQVDAAAVQAMLESVQVTLESLNSAKMQELILIRSSPRYIERVVATLRKHQEEAEKAMSLSRLMMARQAEAVEEEQAVLPKLNLIREKTGHLKSQIEGEISKKYNNRRVNIMGEIMGEINTS